jgi:hypothetical protein
MRKRAGGTHDRDSNQQPTQRAATMNTAERRIGCAGTISRVIVALGLLYLALTNGGALIGLKRSGSATYHLMFSSGGLSWGLTWYDAVLGLVVFPALMVGMGLAGRRFAGQAIHFTGPLGLAINTAVIVALLANPYTAGGAELFYGITLLVAAWYGQPGCEATVLSNLILGRDDQIGCPAFTPIDALETRRRGSGQRPAGHPQAEGAYGAALPPREATHMITSKDQTPLRRGHEREDADLRNPLLHLSACLAVGAVVILVILAIHWLT